MQRNTGPLLAATFVVAMWSIAAFGQSPSTGEPLPSSKISFLPARRPAPTIERLPDPFAEPSPSHPPLLPGDGCEPGRLSAVSQGLGENEGGRLTLGRAEQMAVEFHPALREAAGLLRAARGNWVQVGLRPNPELGYSGAEIGNDGAAGQQGGFVSQELVTAGKLRLNRAVASQEVAAAAQRLEIARLQVLTTVRVYYYDMLVAERAVALARQLNDVAKESLRVSEQRLKALDIPKVSLLQSGVEAESAALLEQQAHERRAAAWRRLSTAIGASDSGMKELEDTLLQPLPALEWDEARERVLSANPELAELRFGVERARWAVQRASAGRVPNVDMSLGAAHDNATDSDIANVTVSMPLPVFDRNQGAIAQARGELTAAQAALRQRELAIEQRLAVAVRDYATARTRAIRYSESILPLARQTLDMTNAGYREGELDYLEVLSVQRTFAEKNLAYLQDLETAWKQWAEIEGLLVGLLPDGPD